MIVNSGLAGLAALGCPDCFGTCSPKGLGDCETDVDHPGLAWSSVSSRYLPIDQCEFYAINGNGAGLAPPSIPASGYDPSNGITYGPINGQYVSLAQFQAWQGLQTAANQTAYSTNLQAIATAVETGSTTPATVNAPNVPVPILTPPTSGIVDNSSSTVASSVPWYEMTIEGFPLWAIGIAGVAGYFLLRKL